MIPLLPENKGITNPHDPPTIEKYKSKQPRTPSSSRYSLRSIVKYITGIFVSPKKNKKNSDLTFENLYIHNQRSIARNNLSKS